MTFSNLMKIAVFSEQTGKTVGKGETAFMSDFSFTYNVFIILELQIQCRCKHSMNPESLNACICIGIFMTSERSR